MKQISRLLSLAAVAALCFSACTEELNNDKINGGKTVTVHFGTENTDPSTKATLTPNEGETAFQAAWENGDKIAVKYTYVADNISEAVPGTWDASTSKFSAEIQDLTEGEKVLEMKYQASYPYSTDGYVDFGSVRTQTGAAYNSIYDLMVAEPVTVTAKPGLDESGNAIVFPMQRQTAIAYFHFTSDNTEAITKATLKVEGENAAIAAKTVLLDPTGMDYETGLSEIVLTTTNQKADDFTLWFNVLPTTYTKMTLTVETATKTFTISKKAKKAEGKYMAGKLYKVKKDGIAWTDKGGSSTPATHVSVVNVDNVNAVKEMGNGTYGDYKDIVQTITVDGLEYSMTNICANSKNGQDGYLMAAKQFIQMKKSTSYIINTKNGVTNIKAWVLPATTNAISVYQGSTSNNISTLINNPNKTTETVKLISNLDKKVDTQLDIYEYTITDGFFKLAPSAPLWLYKLEVTYSNSGSSEPAPDTYSVSCASVTGGTLSASPVKAEAGAEVTLTATPDDGYSFNNDWTVTNAETSEPITVENGTFTMPAANVNVSASFSLKPVDITYDHAGTAEDPYSVADVLKYISTLGTETSNNDVYAKGVITSITEVSTSYGNATYKIKDEDVENEVLVYHGYYLNGAKFTSEDQIRVGDEVVVKGKVKNYNDIPEFDSKNSIVSIVKAPYLNVTASKESGIVAAGETVTITVDTNVDSWKATSDNADFAVGTPRGNTVDVVVSKNTDPTERTATITVTAGTLSKTITLTQSEAGAVTINKFSQTYSYGLKDWSLTDYTDNNSYYLVPSGDNPSVAKISGIFTNKTIQSDVVITLNVATYGNGTNPSASTFSIYADSDCQTSVAATQSGTLPTSKTYTDAVYTVTKENATAFSSDLAIKITKPGRQIRLKSIKIEFSYSESLPSVGGDGGE